VKTATFVKNLTGWDGDARLYKCEPPLDGHDHVIVSAVVALFSGPETYIFPSNAQGEPKDYGELTGSFRGALDHAEALRGAGYEVRT
jgi:hypothetical protein